MEKLIFPILLTISCGPSFATADSGISDGGTTGANPTGASATGDLPTKTDAVADTSAGVMPMTSTDDGPTTSTGLTDSTTSAQDLCEIGTLDAVHISIESARARAEGRAIDTDEICAVVSTAGDPESVTVEFDCPTAGTLRLDIDTMPAIALSPPLTVNDQVHVRAVRNYPIDSGAYHYLTVRELGGDLIAARYGYGTPPNGVDPARYFTPLTFVANDDVCPVIPYEDDGGFILPICNYDEQVLSVEFTDGRRSLNLLHHERGRLGGLEIQLQSALRLDFADGERLCRDNGPFNNISWIALRVE